MNTAELVTLIRDDFATDLSPAKICSYVNRAQKELFNNGCALSIYTNRADTVFPYPALKVVADTLSYDMVEANLVDSSGSNISLAITDMDGVSRPITCRKVKNLFVLSRGIAGFERILYDNSNLYYARGYSNQLVPYRVPAHITDASGMQPAHIQLMQPPVIGSTYYVEFNFSPPDITAVTVPMIIDLDIWTEAILCGVRVIMDDARFGDPQMLLQRWDKWKRKFNEYGNAQAHNLAPLKLTKRKFG